MTDRAYPYLQNRFPSTVIAPDGTVIDRVRTVITPDRLYIYDIDIATEPATVYTSHTIDLVATVPDPTVGGWRLEAADGEWVVRPGGGCGCGPHAVLVAMDDPPPTSLSRP